MEVFKHERHNAYRFTKNLVVIKQKDKVKFWFGGLKFVNFRLNIYPHKKWQFFHWLIRLPLMFFERNNSGVKIGTPNLYLWVIK